MMKAGELWWVRLKGRRFVQKMMIDEVLEKCVRALPVDPLIMADDQYYEIGKDIVFIEKAKE